MQLGVPLAELPLQEFQSEHAELDERVYEVLGVKEAVTSFVSYGSTAPEEVARQVARWKEKLAI
jgi:argininosuccinate lyase